MAVAIALCAAVGIALCAAVRVDAQTAQASRPSRTTPQSAAHGSADDAAAYQALNSNHIDDAEKRFQAILAARPTDAGALAGMGRVRVQQGNYLAAVSFLEQAKQANPNDAMIGAELDSARYSFLVGEGRSSLDAHDPGAAEKRYREALQLRPGAAEALTGLTGVLVQESKPEEARDLLQSEVARQTAANGQPPVEMELQLADLDIVCGQPQAAYAVFHHVVEGHPDRVDAWAGLLSALHLMGRDYDAAEQVKGASAETRAQLEANPSYVQMMGATAGGAAPAQSVATQAPVVAQAPVAAQPAVVVTPTPALAPAALPPPPASTAVQSAPQLAPTPQANTAVQTVVPSVQPPVVQSAVAASVPPPPADVEIQRALALLNVADDAGLYRDLMQLGARTDLSDAQRRAVQVIWLEWGVRRAEAVSASGDTERATEILDAAARSLPDDTTAPLPSADHPQAISTLLNPASPANSATRAASQSGSRPAVNRPSGSGAPLVTQPAAQPASRGGEIPDTGDQQYQQPPKPPKS
jgi:tetratricopeptide (TPR) repeat protein